MSSFLFFTIIDLWFVIVDDSDATKKITDTLDRYSTSDEGLIAFLEDEVQKNPSVRYQLIVILFLYFLSLIL